MRVSLLWKVLVVQAIKKVGIKMLAKQEWIEAAKKTMDQAYVPYSKFPVGACLVTNEGEIYTGVNIENASYGLTNCAERTAIFKAISEGKRMFQHLVVAGDTPEPIAPCGACRQVLAEFCAPDMPVTLLDAQGKVKETTVGQLLPYTFTNKDF